jgi:ATP synthase protein I
MNKKSGNNSFIDQTSLSHKVAAKSALKLLAKKNPRSGVWFGLGMMGLIGWSVVVPTLLGAVLGVWIDKNYAGSYSWTLMLLIIGLILGCLNAWHWVSNEIKEMRDEQEGTDE